MKYDISHLTQETDVVFGPIQDDEALFLYYLIKICGIKYIIEVGGLHGYSSLNFLQALADEGRLITVDPNFTDQNKLLQESNFTLISKNIQDVDVCQIPVPRIDCIFLILDADSIITKVLVAIIVEFVNNSVNNKIE